MKKISNLLMMAVLTVGMGLTSCEDILGHWEKPTPVTPTPVTPTPGGGSSTTVPVTSITLNETTLSLLVGETFQLEATVVPDDATDADVNWNSADADVSIATIDGAGIITAVAAGTTAFVVKAGDKTATCTVTVANPDKYISVASNKKVQFAKGNLQATYDGSEWTWGFATNQWDYIGNAAGNNSINGNGTVSANGTVDLFGWVGESNTTWTGAAQYGISNNNNNPTTANDYGNSTSDKLSSDWGKTIDPGTTWRTLSADEWKYLLNTRRAMKIGTKDNARYVRAKVHGIKGLIIFPNQIVWIETTMGDAPTTCNTGNDNYTYVPTNAQWTVLEAAGCVFLPAAGWRDGSSVNNDGTLGRYWSSSTMDAYGNPAQVMVFNSLGTSVSGNVRYQGCSVRLVRDVTP